MFLSFHKTDHIGDHISYTSKTKIKLFYYTDNVYQVLLGYSILVQILWEGIKDNK